jgi:hypothetical protein
MHTELISIETDTLRLDGAFYRPDDEAAGSVLPFHGNTMNLYVGGAAFSPTGVDGGGFRVPGLQPRRRAAKVAGTLFCDESGGRGRSDFIGSASPDRQDPGGLQ